MRKRTIVLCEATTTMAPLGMTYDSATYLDTDSSIGDVELPNSNIIASHIDSSSCCTGTQINTSTNSQKIDITSRNYNGHLSTGLLTVEQFSNLNYIVRYNDRMTSRIVDIDQVVFSTVSQLVILNDTMRVFIVDPFEFGMLADIIKECRAFCEMALRLGAISRDSYYAPAYLEGKCKDANEIQKMRLHYRTESSRAESHTEYSLLRVSHELGIVVSDSEVEEDDGNDEDDEKLIPVNDASSSSNVVSHNTSAYASAHVANSGVPINTRKGTKRQPQPFKLPKGKSSKEEIVYEIEIVKCTYCQVAKSIAPETEFFLHPFIPRSFQGLPYFFCSTCIHNWKEYRDDAEVHEQLILPGEVNEELCAMCSTTPDELVMCSFCPRSFCHECLRKNLLETEFENCRADDDWPCMSCSNGLKELGAVPRSLWIKVKVGDVQNSWSPSDWQGMWGWIERSRLLGPMQGSQQHAGPTGKGGNSRNNKHRSIVYKSDEDDDDDILEVYKVNDESGDERLKSSSPTGRRRRGGNNRGGRGRGKNSASSPSEPSSRKKARSNDRPFSDPSRDPKTTFQLGSQVLARYQNKRAWFPGAIVSLGTVPGTFNVQYEDGEFEENVHVDAMKLTGGYLPPVDETKGETYFFAEYVKHLEATYKSRKNAKIESEDSCYLCKDGGDLVECDWKNPAASTSRECRPHCKKVYHTYCMGGDPGEKELICMRHLCDTCGSGGAIEFICRYCPLTFCRKCSLKEGLIFARIKKKRYLLLNEAKHPRGKFEFHSDLDEPVKQIACGNCVEHIEAALSSQFPNIKFPIGLVHGVERCWPITPDQEGQEEAGSSIYRKDKSGRRLAVDDDNNRRGRGGPTRPISKATDKDAAVPEPTLLTKYRPTEEALATNWPNGFLGLGLAVKLTPLELSELLKQELAAPDEVGHLWPNILKKQREDQERERYIACQEVDMEVETNTDIHPAAAEMQARCTDEDVEDALIALWEVGYTQERKRREAEENG